MKNLHLVRETKALKTVNSYLNGNKFDIDLALNAFSIGTELTVKKTELLLAQATGKVTKRQLRDYIKLENALEEKMASIESLYTKTAVALNFKAEKECLTAVKKYIELNKLEA